MLHEDGIRWLSDEVAIFFACLTRCILSSDLNSLNGKKNIHQQRPIGKW